MAGQVYSVKAEFGLKGHSKTTCKQVLAAGKRQYRDEEQAGTLGVVNQFFVQSGFSCTKYSGAFRLRIKNGSTIGRGNHPSCSYQEPGTAAECWHRPGLVAAEILLVIDFFSVGRKIVYILVAFVIRKLQRLPARSEHQEHLGDAANRGNKRHGVAIG